MSLFKYDFSSKPTQSGDEPSTSSSLVTENQSENVLSASSSAVDEKQTEKNDSESDSDGENPPKRKKESVTKTKFPAQRKYHPGYLKYGFYFTEKDGKECPLCVVCDRVLANSSMAITKWIRHFSKHKEVQDKPTEYFQSLKNKLKGQAHVMKTYSNTESAAIEASFVVAYEIAKTKKNIHDRRQSFNHVWQNRRNHARQSRSHANQYGADVRHHNLSTIFRSCP